MNNCEHYTIWSKTRKHYKKICFFLVLVHLVIIIIIIINIIIIIILIIVVIIEWSVNQCRDLDPDLIMSDLIKYRPTLCLLHIDHAGDDDDHNHDHQLHHIITYDWTKCKPALWFLKKRSRNRKNCAAFQQLPCHLHTELRLGWSMNTIYWYTRHSRLPQLVS